jgi:hypothetical protein
MSAAPGAEQRRSRLLVESEEQLLQLLADAEEDAAEQPL